MAASITREGLPWGDSSVAVTRLFAIPLTDAAR